MKFKHVLLAFIFVFCLSFVGCNKKESKPSDEQKEPTEHVHSFGDWITVIEPSCETKGMRKHECSECGEIENESIEALGHDLSEATCSSKAKCSICGEKIGEFADHKYSEWEVINEATCMTTGLRTHKCVWCGKVENDIIPSPEHIYSNWKILQSATCIETGLREHTCSVGGETVREVIPVIDHTFNDWVIEDPATCIKEGSRKHQCSYCELSEVETIKMIDHNYKDPVNVVEATCLEVGVKKYVCSTCNHEKEEVTETLEHNFVDEVCTKCKTRTADYEHILSIINKVQIEVNENDGVVLPQNIDGVEITWISHSQDIVLDDGTLFAAKFVRNANMEATFNYNGKAYHHNFEIEIPVVDVRGIDFCWSIFYSKKVIDNTYSDLAFITKNYGECTVYKYTTSNPSIISETGNVHLKLYDQRATVSCYLQLGKVINKYEKVVTVKGFNEKQRVDLVLEWLPSVIEELKNGTRTTLPITHDEYGTTINWFCMEPGIIAGNGVFVKPLTKKNLTLECSVVLNGSSGQTIFNLEQVGGDTSELDQLREWIKGQIPSRIMGTKNFVLDNDALDYQIRTNSGGVLNLIDGSTPSVDRSMLIDINRNDWKNRFWGSGYLGTNYHPFVSQEILNEMMYNGYLLPNEQNIVWITVHESGMPRANNDAKLLADVQMDTATGKRSREASWNYQVDENMIYQSFEDEVICWHAGDGTATIGNGNNNSIGIEMCINEDGSYEGAMRHDAKLIAMLLHKYNLSLANVKRHYDWSGKICPNYMITQGRWLEFLGLVDKEYTAMKLLKGKKVTWTVTTDTCDNTEEVLDTYFTHAASTIYIAKNVNQKTVLHITMQVEYEGQILSHTSDLTLYPEK